VTLIGVKSKYGSCSGSCTGVININNTPIHIYMYVYIYIYKETSIIGKMGWAVNSIVKYFYEFESLVSYKEWK
jgi:hypothetical protein